MALAQLSFMEGLFKQIANKNEDPEPSLETKNLAHTL